MTVNIAKPLLDEQEILEVTRVINSGMLASGPETSKFEIEFADFVGSKYACAVNNGTSAICLALSAMGISPGDEVITTPMTFVATANSILSCGAIPVFADVEESTFNLSPSAVEDAITEKTKAILPVHLYGLPADMESLRSIAEVNDIALIGDAAQAHGAKLGEKMVGTLGDVECFSFYPTKNMTTGEGGMLTTNQEEIFQRIVSIRNHGRINNEMGTYEHEGFGLNLRTTDIASAIGRVQLKKLPSFNSVRERNAKLLTSLLSEIDDVELPSELPNSTHAWHQYTIRVKDRMSLREYLASNGIGSGIYYPRLIQDYPHLNKFKSSCPIAERIVSEVISLPVHAGLSEEDVVSVADCILLWSSKNV